MLSPFNLFKRKVTASEIGRLGNAVKRSRERQRIRDKCDEMRAALGLPKVEWPQ